ncbi:hypothetical protein QTO34_000832 [Cnephaeus nilssonii]|uniref:Uncharacterized protein n=1 Tax=Cnephaeus nilssonii TaxID=3371016 RepID=A0AA40IC50_CNENI|nr:hypothetical protein QTO34_000832 [Eptesicus nilssonii]
MKKDQLEIKHTLTEIKNIIQRPNSRQKEHKNQVKDLEYKEAKDTPPEKQEEKRIQKVEDSVRSLWDNFKRTNIRIMGVPEEEREQDAENLFEEIMTKNFPHLEQGEVEKPSGAIRASSRLHPLMAPSDWDWCGHRQRVQVAALALVAGASGAGAGSRCKRQGDHAVAARLGPRSPSFVQKVIWKLKESGDFHTYLSDDSIDSMDDAEKENFSI